MDVSVICTQRSNLTGILCLHLLLIYTCSIFPRRHAALCIALYFCI